MLQSPEGHFLVWRDSTPLSYTITIPVNKMACKSALSFMRDQAKVGALKRLTLSSSKTAGRNSSGRITSYHRGGGAKRLQRKVDVKRGTNACQVVQ
jgi:ribosomal protein L2